MKIIEYNHDYAQLVADMWNKSNSSWGNDESIKTKEEIISQENSNGNLKTYLALDEGMVVGYCSFSEYKHDEGASYLPLLNVIPEYHGKKVGKALILTVLEDAIKSEWSRHDLYTWSGNIKAMPLYKKCGFFWERKNDTVHLMNFIPYMYQTEALESYINKIDWYKDSVREINMEHDGRKENGFEFYEYHFKNEETEMKLEFEKTGRGLTCIDTKDYMIRMRLPKNELVINDNYEVEFMMVNKGDEDLNVSILGVNNKNITSDFNMSLSVKDEMKVTGKFHVGEISKNQDKGKTHPVVEATLLINGKKAIFKIGLEPLFPVQLKLKSTEYNHVLNKEYVAYLDIVNNSDQKETFNIVLPDTNFITFVDSTVIELESKEKRSIAIKYVLQDFGFYDEECIVSYGNKKYQRKVTSAFKGSASTLYGETEISALLFSGNYSANYYKPQNIVAFQNGHKDQEKPLFFAAQIGLPYSLEFNNAKPEIKQVSNTKMEITFHSNAFKNVDLKIYVDNMFGLYRVNYELVNNSDQDTFSLAIPVWMSLEDCIVPFNNKFLKIEEPNSSDFHNLNHELVDENWIYNHKDRFGFVWDKSLKMKITEWRMTFEINNINITKGSSYTSPDFYVSCVHNEFQDFRAFAGNTVIKDETKYLDVATNNGNPFTDSIINYKVINNKKNELNGSVVIDGNQTDINEINTVKPGLNDIEVLMNDKNVSFKRLAFKKEGKVIVSNDTDSIIVNNGILEFKASEKYADSIYSLVFNNKEWLDSNYPTPKERVWWGDFVGGLTQRIQGLQDIAALKEKRSITEVTLTDNYESKWTGIKVSMEVINDPEMKGLVFDTYTVTLPGVPLVHSFTNVTNKSGKLLYDHLMVKFNTLKIDEIPENVRYNYENTIYKCNNISLDAAVKKFVQFESSREYKLGIYNKNNNFEVSSQKGFLIVFSEKKITVPDRESKQISGDFLLFTKEELSRDMLKDLENIRFEV